MEPVQDFFQSGMERFLTHDRIQSGTGADTEDSWFCTVFPAYFAEIDPLQGFSVLFLFDAGDDFCKIASGVSEDSQVSGEIVAGSVFWGSQMAVSSGAYHRKGNYIFRKNPAEHISENKNRRADRRRIPGGGNRGGFVFCSGLRFCLARRQVIFYHLFSNMSIHFFHFFYFFLPNISRANISPISRSSGVVIFIFL